MSLRDDLIEAGARRLHPFAWQKSHNIVEAEAFLDAVLDTLADRADEWYEAGIPEWDNTRAYQSMKRVVVKSTIRPLIAVLRGDTEETGER